MKIQLNNITLLGIDCINPSRLQKVMDLCEEKIAFAESKILSSDYIDDTRLVKINKISSYEDFSKFCLCDLKKYVDTEFVLLVQWDGFILNPNSWTNDFLDYDYIGSPWVVKDWSINDFDFPEELRGQLVVGNGGFCIRSKKFLEVSSMLYDSGHIKRIHPEDIAISVWYRKLFENKGIKFAPPEVAKKFSIEGGDYTYTDQFGFHGFYTNIDRWIELHPDYSDEYVLVKNKPRSTWKPPKINIT